MIRLGAAMLGATLLFSTASAEVAFVSGYDRFYRDNDDAAADGGMLLLTELSCTACHAADHDILRPKNGPDLSGAGDRLARDWIKRYLNDPQKAKPGAAMPNVLASWNQADKARAVEALAAFLATQHQPFPQLNSTASNPIAQQFWDKGDADRGSRLYHQVGCVACHEPDDEYEAKPHKPSDFERLISQLDPIELKELGLADAARPVRSVPHGDLTSKYSRKSLTFFLLDPAKTRPDGRMPDFKLTPDEAADIAQFLMKGQAGKAPQQAPSATLVKEGRRLFRELRCANCHHAKGAEPAKMARPLRSLDLSQSQGCVGRPTKGAVHYSLDDGQRAAIAAGIVKAGKTADLSPEKKVHFNLLQRNCFGCHERGERGGVGPNRRPYFETAGHVDLGDEGRLPPPLTGVGGKLKAAWLKTVLQGKGDVRPYMHARMPIFAGVDQALPGLFREADPTPGSPLKTIDPPKKSFAAGRAVLDVGCVQCHPIRGESLPGVVGIDLADVGRRIERKWFDAFLLDPARLKPRTRMPTFFPNGKSNLKQVLGGDVDRQIAAAWGYLNDVQRQPLPEKLVKARHQSFEIVPGDRPVVQRTFMKRAGTHAVAVGFPAKIHFAFDAEEVRPAIAWRGRFIDAHGVWFDRFAPPSAPLGESLIRFPDGFPLRTPGSSTKAPDPRFLGYRIDEVGVPTFLYRFGNWGVEDRIEPFDEAGLRRTMKIKRLRQTDQPAPLAFVANAGSKIERREGVIRNEQGLQVSITRPDEIGQARRSGDVDEWLVPLKFNTETTIEVTYQW